MSTRRIVGITAAIAFLPGLLWLVVLAIITDPDEGANIGGGIIGLGIILVSWVAAVGFLGTALARRDREQGISDEFR